jgi:hypothetical protein
MKKPHYQPMAMRWEKTVSDPHGLVVNTNNLQTEKDNKKIKHNQ